MFIISLRLPLYLVTLPYLNLGLPAVGLHLGLEIGFNLDLMCGLAVTLGLSLLANIYENDS